MSNGILVVLSGFSGSGKGTMVRRLMEKYPLEYALSVSATTRQPRAGELDGVHYFFKTVEEFEQMIAENELIEYAKYVDNYYGTPREYVRQQMEAGRNVILEIEMQGALQIRDKIPEAKLIFVAPPSAEELKKRLNGRGTETPEVIEHRLRRAVEEAEYLPGYDYLIINDRLESAVDSLHGLIEAERTQHTEQVGYMRISEQGKFIEQISRGLADMAKGE